jgi:hypothetical protein
MTLQDDSRIDRRLDARPRIYVGLAAAALAGAAAEFVHTYYQKEFEWQSKISLRPPKPVALLARELMEDGQRRNCYSMVIVCEPTANQIRGVVELWALSPSILQSLLAGRIDESHLCRKDFRKYSPKVRELYVAITAPRRHWDEASPPLGGDIALGCLLGALLLLDRAYFERGQKKMHLYGLEASGEGGEMMQRLGFDSMPGVREDGQRVWKLHATAKLVAAQRAKWAAWREFVFPLMAVK